jgi:hypothetical protein
LSPKIIALLLLLFLLAKTPDIFGMQTPLTEQQLDVVVQNFKTAVEAAKPYNLWLVTLLNGVTVASGITATYWSKECIDCLQIFMSHATSRTKQPIKEYIFLGTALVLTTAQAVKGSYDIYNSNTCYRIAYQQANIYPPFILMQLLAHPDLQDDTTQQALKDTLATKTKS